MGDGIEKALLQDIGYLALKTDRRPRPYPYTPSTLLTCIANVAADTWGIRASMIPEDTFAFGDTPNYIQIQQIAIEAATAAKTYELLFEEYNAVTFVFNEIGAVRFTQTGALVASLHINCPMRPVNNDDWSIWGSIRSAEGGGTVSFSLIVARCLPVHLALPDSTGVWPTG